MTPSPLAVACRYRYDPLDRLASSQPSNQTEVRAFYQKSRLATEIQGRLQRTLFQHDDYLLAQQLRTATVSETSLLATDQQRSVLQRTSATERESLVYSAYGHHPADSGLSCLSGFNGERCDPLTGHYLLGNGYRAFNPVLMRFNSPDSLSPFGKGGLNAYAYCQGDPVNFSDPTGHAKYFNIVPKVRRVKFRITDPIKRRSLVSSPRAVAKPVSDTIQKNTVDFTDLISKTGENTSQYSRDTQPIHVGRPRLTTPEEAALMRYYRSILSVPSSASIPSTVLMEKRRLGFFKKRVIASAGMVDILSGRLYRKLSVRVRASSERLLAEAKMGWELEVKAATDYVTYLNTKSVRS